MELTYLKFSRRSLRNPVLVAFLLSIALVIFIIIFQPYDYNRLSLKLFIELISLVFICTFIFSIAFQMTIKISYLRNSWNILFLWLFYTALISQVLYFYTIIKGYNDFSLAGVVIYFITSLALSLIPFLIYFLLFKRTLSPADQKQIELNNQIFSTDKVLLFKAEDNYVRVIYLDKNSKPVSVMIRNTMKDVLKEAGNRIFIRIHRSYAININHFSHHSGNQKGYFAHLYHLDQKFPVSRSNRKLFLKKIRTICH